MSEDSNKKYSLILASQSPRRKELLGWLDIPFEIHTKHVEEISSHSDPSDVAEDLAAQKGEAAFSDLKKRTGFGETFFPLVISSDTLVALNGKIYGKPQDRAEAKAILKELSGNTHTVVTGVYLSKLDLKSGEILDKVFSIKTNVTFSMIDEDILENYLDSKESLDKAGAYGIQGKGLSFITEIEGSYSNVVGFPLHEFHRELKEFLGNKDDQQGNWRKLFHV